MISEDIKLIEEFLNNPIKKQERLRFLVRVFRSFEEDYRSVKK